MEVRKSYHGIPVRCVIAAFRKSSSPCCEGRGDRLGQDKIGDPRSNVCIRLENSIAEQNLELVEMA
jgi:hypothetical protein